MIDDLKLLIYDLGFRSLDFRVLIYEGRGGLLEGIRY